MSAVNGVLAVADILRCFQLCWHHFTGIPAVVVCSDVPATYPVTGVPSFANTPAVSQVLDVVELVIVITCLLLLVSLLLLIYLLLRVLLTLLATPVLPTGRMFGHIT
jgi:hypothetical protein